MQIAISDATDADLLSHFEDIFVFITADSLFNLESLCWVTMRLKQEKECWYIV